MPSPQKLNNNLLMLQPCSLWRLVPAKYLPTNYPHIPFLSLQLGPHKREQTITTVKAPQRRETHYNPGRHEKEGCGESLYWWRRNWTWLKSKQNKPPTKHKHLAHFVNGPRTKLICSYTRALLRRRDEKDKCLKGEIFPLFGWHIYTIMCRIQSGATGVFSFSTSHKKFFPFLSPPFLLWCQVD